MPAIILILLLVFSVSFCNSDKAKELLEIKKQYDTLQVKYNKLKSDHEKLKADMEKYKKGVYNMFTE